MDNSERINTYIAENYDRLQILIPKGGRRFLRKSQCRFHKLNLNRYVNALIELDLRGNVDWSDFNGDCTLLSSFSKAEER